MVDKRDNTDIFETYVRRCDQSRPKTRIEEIEEEIERLQNRIESLKNQLAWEKSNAR